MSGDVTAVRAKAHEYLVTRFGEVEVNSEGDFSLGFGTARIYVKVRTGEAIDWTWVALEVPLLYDIPESPEVFEYVALHADDYTFGHLNAHRADTGLLIFFSHSLLGESLSAPALVRAVGMMLFAADQLGGTLHEMFGGTRFGSG